MSVLMLFQQNYNHMESRLSFATMATDQVVNCILAKMNKQISLIEFTKRNQSNWVLHSQENTFDTTFKHLENGPGISPSKKDSEPKTIPQDTLTSTAPAPNLTPTLFRSDIGSSIHSDSKQLSARKSKPSHYSILSLASSKPQSKIQKQVPRKFELVDKRPVEIEGDYVERLREFKIEEEKLLDLKKKTTERAKIQCKLQKGEEIVFDYEGGFSKRKQNQAKQFQYKASVGVRDREGAKKKSISQQGPQAKAESVVIMNRQMQKKLKLSQENEEAEDERLVVFDNKSRKEEMLQSIEINNPGIKMTVDGQAAKRNHTQAQDYQHSRASQKVKTVQLRRSSLESNIRFKTQFTMEDNPKSYLGSPLGSNPDLPSTKRVSASKKRRVQTEASNYSGSKAQKISVENYLLHKMVLQSEADLESSYIRIPSKNKNPIRVKTNVDSSIINEHSESASLQIRQKLANMTKEGDRLPRILSHYKQAESQILKQMRRKNKL